MINEGVKKGALTRLRRVEGQVRGIMKMVEEESRNRFKAASSIMKIQQSIDSGMKPEEIKNKMSQLMDNMVQIDSEDDLK